jgi:hypothetical protein
MFIEVDQMHTGTVGHDPMERAGRRIKSPLQPLARRRFSPTGFIRCRMHSMNSDDLALRQINAIR